jgi:hypothetical protein
MPETILLFPGGIFLWACMVFIIVMIIGLFMQMLVGVNALLMQRRMKE